MSLTRGALVGALLAAFLQVVVVDIVASRGIVSSNKRKCSSVLNLIEKRLYLTIKEEQIRG